MQSLWLETGDQTAEVAGHGVDDWLGWTFSSCEKPYVVIPGKQILTASVNNCVVCVVCGNDIVVVSAGIEGTKGDFALGWVALCFASDRLNFLPEGVVSVYYFDGAIWVWRVGSCGALSCQFEEGAFGSGVLVPCPHIGCESETALSGEWGTLAQSEWALDWSQEDKDQDDYRYLFVHLVFNY